MPTTGLGTMSTPVKLISLILAVISFAYLAWKSLFSHDPEVDFRFLWLAGRLWADGIDPYSSRYTMMGSSIFPDGNEIAYWLYPPQWWPICRPLAAMPIETALTAWRTLNAILLIAGGCLMLRGVGLATAPYQWPAGLALLALFPLIAATPQVLAMGQTTILVFFGLCCIGFAMLRGGTLAMAIGLVLLILKPQLGAVAVAAVAVERRWWPAILIAGISTLLTCLPQLIAHGLTATVDGFLTNLRLHATISANGPDNLTGVVHLVWLTTGTALGMGSAVGLGVLAVLGAGWTLRSARSVPADMARFLVLLAGLLIFVPLHDYDFVCLLPAAPLFIMLNPRARQALAVAIILVIRPALIAKLLHLGDHGEVFVLTISALAIGLTAILAVRRAADNGKAGPLPRTGLDPSPMT